MLDKLRSNKGGIITYVFLGAIIFVFVAYFGPGSYDKGCGAAQGASWAAQVNGERIPLADFERGYSSLMRSFQQQAGQAFTRELAEQLGLTGMALNQLVDHALVIQEARRQGLVVTDDELARAIFSLPAFQANGTFDKDAYLRYADNAYGSATRFEKALRDDLLYQHLLAGVRETVKVSEAEIREAWTTEHDQVSLQLVRFPLAAAEADVKKPSEAEAAAFAAKAPARIEAAFREQAARFDQPRKVKARQIVAKVAPGAPPADEDKARQRAEALAGRVAKGEDFATVASQASEDEATKARGGDLGVLSEGLVEKAFAEAVFPLATGAVSKPFRTAAGWTVVKVEEAIPARKVTLDQARPELARELLLKDRARALAGEKAAAALAAARAGKALGDLFPGVEEAKKAGHPQVKLGTAVIAAESTGLFGAGATYVPRLGAAPELVAAALAGSAGQVLEQVFDTAQGPVVALVEKREKPDPAQFQAQKDAVAERLRGRKAQQVEQAWLKGLRDTSDVKVNPAVRMAAPPDEG